MPKHILYEIERDSKHVQVVCGTIQSGRVVLHPGFASVEDFWKQDEAKSSCPDKRALRNAAGSSPSEGPAEQCWMRFLEQCHSRAHLGKLSYNRRLLYPNLSIRLPDQATPLPELARFSVVE